MRFKLGKAIFEQINENYADYKYISEDGYCVYLSETSLVKMGAEIQAELPDSTCGKCGEGEHGVCCNKTLAECNCGVEDKCEIDDSIDVRYESDVIYAFNKFIKKWCGKWYPHLIDDDENDGQFMREKIIALGHQKQDKCEEIELIRTYPHCKHPEYPTNVIVNKVNELITAFNNHIGGK